MPELFNTPPLDAARALARLSPPPPIAADWHPLLGARLAVFPRSVGYAGAPGAAYWPDLATFVEDERTRQMMYCPSEASPYWLLLVFHKQPLLWETYKYKDAELVGYSQGASYEQAMANATLLGPQPDER